MFFEVSGGGEAAWKCCRVVTTGLVHDEPSLEKSIRLLEISVGERRTNSRALREINLRAMPYEWTLYQERSSETCPVSNELSHILFTYKHNRVFRGHREPSRTPEHIWNVWEARPENWRNLFMSVFVQAYRSPLDYIVMYIWKG